jgi:hypothetical protein
MVSAVVDPQSGELATEWCPTRTRQWFRPGKEPQQECHLHTGPPQGQIAIDANGNAQPSGHNDPVAAVAKGIGNILKKIIRW